ncbi:MAG: type II toxin-antitoxin system HicB family antitoxin [Candidatus Lambdaproteobacteria bacterium]|nr:type II toxin-antitoxin system HicB family antitoxin [Candidatus Lambdaproteobacteria bacterium]
MRRQKPTRVPVEAKLPYRLMKEGGWIVSRCDLLGISSQGKTERTAIRNLRDAIVLYLEGWLENGTLAEKLAARGFHLVEIAGQPLWAAGGEAERGGGALDIKATLQPRQAIYHLQSPVGKLVPAHLPWMIKPKIDAHAQAA